MGFSVSLIFSKNLNEHLLPAGLRFYISLEDTSIGTPFTIYPSLNFLRYKLVRVGERGGRFIETVHKLPMSNFLITELRDSTCAPFSYRHHVINRRSRPSLNAASVALPAAISHPLATLPLPQPPTLQIICRTCCSSLKSCQLVALTNKSSNSGARTSHKPRTMSG